MVKAKSSGNVCWCCGDSHGRGALVFGLFLLVLGLLYISQDLGIISTGISIWPLILVFLGVWLIIPRVYGR